ncbi:uncharacterized protein LOC109829877 [Asparagus officinalis]|uniref:uncharacterized protein LOC109829877 n=1 Tax=Asparagus officinalis TaxID=4686 RepID=UPI00098E1A6C|nr:uncharacterized protein LOC109829877 [Asparagus officinalis]
MSNSLQLFSPLRPMQFKEEKEESSSSSSSSLREEKVQVKEKRFDSDHGHDHDDDGYHTPTSPSHRIPVALECPPAPKKASLRRRCKKRKACCLIEVKDVELIFAAKINDGDRSKKVKEEIVANE